YVIILHLSPKHESVADKVLQGSTRMPVIQVSEPTPLEPDHVYVISPNHDLTMSDGHLHVAKAQRPRGHHIAIDLFFRTLADTHQDKAVGIILSGSDSDGSVGIARIKEQGGVTFVQAPQDAEYDDMPRNAIATGQVDFVLPVTEIPNKLIEWWNNARAIQLPQPPEADAPILDTPPDSRAVAERAFRDILELLAARSGHDFRHYKRATVLRRIERRMQVSMVRDLPAYREFLKTHPEETAALLDDMLIGVTNFFRDRESFEALEREVIPELFRGARDAEQVRVWVPACATGEEAYSIAMLLADEADGRSAPPQYQVFASDIDQSAIQFGRAGVYPESIITDVPPARLRQFFSKEQRRYRVNKNIRDRVLFALHNVLRDPPFSRIDLISCRNLLIYLEREVQTRLLEMFHFALRSGGFLFLGSSESADAAASHFETVDKRHRIYRARNLARNPRQVSMLPLRLEGPVTPQAAMQAAERRGFSFADVHQRVLEFYAPPSVIVDHDSNIVHLSEHAGRFLRMPGGAPTHNLVAAVDPALRTDLRSTLFQALHTNKSTEVRVKVEEDGKPVRFVNIVARPFRDAEAGAEFVLVMFHEVEDALGANLEKPAGEAQENAVLRNMEEELQRTRDRLQATIEQYETSNEELKASNEELQAINEELRSATEELETSKEELQSVNEELTTVTFELKTKVEETAKVNDDLQNFIASTDIATIFVDPGLRIKRYTPRATDIFNIIPTDIGRSLLDITSRLDYPQLTEDARATFESLKVIEREVRSADWRWYVARVLPYRTAENRIDGAVLTFIDTTTLRMVEQRINAGEEQLRVAAESARDYAIMVLDENGIVTAWNSGATQLFGWTPAEMIGNTAERIFTPEDVAAGVPQQELANAHDEGRAPDQRWHLMKNGDRIYCSGIMMRIENPRFRGYIKIARDATQSELRSLRGDERTVSGSELRREVEAASALKDDFLAVISHELKNPLNLISVNTQLLARLPQAKDSPPMQNALEMINRAIRGQGKIIDDLLDMSRLRTGKLVLNMEAVDMGALACSIVEAAKADSSSAGLELTCTIADEPVLVRADPGRLEQIIWNLVSNAVKYTPAGGRIEVSVSIEGALGRLTVRDTGQGIEAHFIPRIFEMFGQAPSRALSGKGGLGIGLALVKQLVERHAGRIEVESAGLGKGSTFSVWLPRYDYALVAPAHALPATESAGAWEGMKVLIADDSAEAADTLGRLLELEGAKVTMARDGQEALAKFGNANSQQAPFDIVFADIGMPNMDGYELARLLRELPGGRHVPLVALTGFTRHHDVQRALQSGFDAHIGKPLSIDALTATMQRLMDEREGKGEA
ncbi:MAG TPA: CheR family methyltransferase, partial [Rhodanobacteraceae bacterium]|nr:CheR family methyltransferase [Rhodanobacteraceae bacterium]